MENGFWRVLLVVGAASAATANSLWVRPRPLSYEEAVELSADLYNQNAGENVTFLLFKVAPHPEWDANSANAQELDFTLKEAVCLAPKSKPPKLEKEEEEEEEECSFKDHGLLRKCFGYSFLNEQPPAAVLVCSEASEEEEEPKRPKRVKRFKKFWRKTRRRLRKGLKKAGRRILKSKVTVVIGKLALSTAGVPIP